MKALLSKTSDFRKDNTIIEVNTIQDLLDIVDKNGEYPIIFQRPIFPEDNPNYDIDIEIYDDYRE